MPGPVFLAVWVVGFVPRAQETLTLHTSLPPTLQLRELEDKYAECMEMLHEAQEELKNLRNKTVPNATSRRYHSLGLFPMVRAACFPTPLFPPTGAQGCSWQKAGLE